MFNKRSQFTLIELIVVIAVLGILAAIVIPNISNFQQKAKEVQLTADVRNLQTAVDMYRIDSLDGVSEPVGAHSAIATHEVLEDGKVVAIAENAHVKVQILDMDGLYPDYLRDIPDSSVNAEISADLAADSVGADSKVLVDFEKGEVVFGTMLEDGSDTDDTTFGKSTAILKAVSLVDNPTDSGATKVVAIVR